MRCAEVGRLVDRFVDDRLPPAEAAEVGRHAAGCAGCRRLVQDARSLARRLAADAAAVRPPRGFAGRVMDAVLREALWKPAAASAVTDGARAATGAAAARAAARGYRRLGFCVMLGAAVLVAGIALPRTVGIGAAGGGSAIVERVLAGADGAVQGALSAAGGSAARIVEGGSR